MRVVIKEHEAVIEVPKDLVQLKQSENTSENSREKLIVLELARRAALGTFPSIPERVIGLYDEDPPIWCADRPPRDIYIYKESNLLWLLQIQSF